MKVGNPVWHSKRIVIDNAETTDFEKPTKIITRFNYFTCMQTNDYLSIVKYGDKVSSMWTCVANARAFKGKIKKGDLFWVDGEIPPKQEDLSDYYGYGQSANAKVVGVVEQNHCIIITLEANQDKE